MGEIQIDIDHLGMEVTKLRKANGWSVEKMMIYTGMTKGTIFGYANGSKAPSFERFVNIVKEMGYTTEIVIDDPIQGETWTDLYAVPDLIKYLMQDRNISADEMAKKVGVSTNAIYKWMLKGSFNSLKKVCGCLGIPIRVYLKEK